MSADASPEPIDFVTALGILFSHVAFGVLLKLLPAMIRTERIRDALMNKIDAVSRPHAAYWISGNTD